jgi:hypothetical protein
MCFYEKKSLIYTPSVFATTLKNRLSQGQKQKYALTFHIISSFSFEKKKYQLFCYLIRCHLDFFHLFGWEILIYHKIISVFLLRHYYGEFLKCQINNKGGIIFFC